MIPYDWLEEAERRIRPYIRTTPLQYDQGKDLYLKWENRQVTGSFKVRGALNKVLNLVEWERERGLVAASAGNHGQGVALAGRMVASPVRIFVPENAVPAKVEAIRAQGAEVYLIPGGYGEAERTALAYATANQATWISPYNDGQVIAGQGTLGLEILEQLPRLERSTWIVPVSGGGLIAGIGSAIKLKSAHPNASRKTPNLVGVQSEASAFMHALYHHGSQQGIEEFPSIADGLAGPVEPGSVTIPLANKLLDDLILVTESEIREAIRHAWFEYGERIEGSGAVALAAVISGKISTRPAVLIQSGGNIQPELHAEIVAKT
jgi:threonine dehydratase